MENKRLDMKPRNPLVVIPTYNEADNIERLIREIAGSVQGIRVLVVDDNSPDNQVREWARQNCVVDRLNLTGRVSSDELVRLYRQASVVVVPSRYEGFGLPAVEAMAFHVTEPPFKWKPAAVASASTNAL